MKGIKSEGEIFVGKTYKPKPNPFRDSYRTECGIVMFLMFIGAFFVFVLRLC